MRRFLNIHTLFFFALLTLSSSSLSAEWWDEVKQPVKFSHKLHAGENKIACEYCHSYARRSKFAGAPPMETCYGCHNIIKGSTPERQKNIAEVLKYKEKGEPIKWNRVHDLPEFVYFSHKRHLSAGFDCTNCHGNVTEVVQPVPYSPEDKTNPRYGEIPLSMGWCMSCHKQEHPALDGKIFGPKHVTRGNPMTVPAKGQANGKLIGPKDCYTCHK